MNRERAKELLPIIQAFADGKTIQYRWDETCEWEDAENPSWSRVSEYRIKPEPKLRPWKPEEVPVGALYRQKGCWTSVILSCYEDKIQFLQYGKLVYDHLDIGCLFEGREHSIDNGKTWLPCGVMKE